MIADDGRDYGFSTRHAKEFLEALTRRLEVDARYVMPGYEDALYYLWRERTLPENVDPLDSKLEDPTERAQMARVFEQAHRRGDRLRPAVAPHDVRLPA